MRQDVFNTQPLMTSSQLDKKLKELYPQDYREMPSAASAQRIGQVCREQFRDFILATAKYNKEKEQGEKSSFNGKPRLPGYAKKYRTFYVSRNGFKIQDGLLRITGGKKFGFQPLKITCCQNQHFNAKASEAVCSDVRICPKANCFVIEIIYRKEVNLEKSALLNRNYSLLTDIGLDNIVACVATKVGVPPLLVKGGGLKSINQWWNKRVGELQSQGKYQHVESITFKRNNQIDDYIHKVAHIVVSYCLAFDIGRIIIGLNPDWKQRANMGKVNNQKFCNIPHRKLIDNIKYLAEEYGIIWCFCRAMKFNREDTITALFCGSKKSLVHGSVMSKVLFSNPAIIGVVLLPTMLYHAYQLIIVSIIAKKWAEDDRESAS